MEGLRILSQKVQHTACKWQNQDRNPGLPPVIVPDAMRGPGPYTVLGVYLPGIPSLERNHRHRLPYQAGCNTCPRYEYYPQKCGGMLLRHPGAP